MSDAPAPDVDAPVLVLSERAMFRRTFRRVVESLGRRCRDASDGAGAAREGDAGARGAAFALVLVDAGGNGAAAAVATLEAARRALGDVRIACAIDHPDDAAVDTLMAAGAAGALVKAAPPAALARSLEVLLAGGQCRPAPSVSVPVEGVPEAVRARLGAREQKMLRMIAGGRSVPDVAAALHLTPARVVADMRRIMDVVRGRA